MKKLICMTAVTLCLLLSACEQGRIKATFPVLNTPATPQEYLEYPKVLGHEITYSRKDGEDASSKPLLGTVTIPESGLFINEIRSADKRALTVNDRGFLTETMPEGAQWVLLTDEELEQADGLASRYLTTLFTSNFRTAEEYAANIEAVYDCTLTSDFAGSLRDKGAAAKMAQITFDGGVTTEVKSITNKWCARNSPDAIRHADGLLQLFYSVEVDIAAKDDGNAIPHYFDMVPLACSWEMDTPLNNKEDIRFYRKSTDTYHVRLFFSRTDDGLRIDEFYVYASRMSRGGVECISAFESGVKKEMRAVSLPCFDGIAPLTECSATEFYSSAYWGNSAVTNAKNITVNFLKLLTSDYSNADSKHFEPVLKMCTTELAQTLESTGYFERLTELGRNNGMSFETKMQREPVLTARYTMQDYEIDLYETCIAVRMSCGVSAEEFGLPKDGTPVFVTLRCYISSDGDKQQLKGFCLYSADDYMAGVAPEERWEYLDWDDG